MEAQGPIRMVAARESFTRRPVGWQLFLGLLAVTLVLAVGLAAFQIKPNSDLPVFTLAGARILRGEKIYQPGNLNFTYPPLSAVIFVPLAILPEWSHRPIWYLVNIAALAVILYCLHRRLRPGMLPATQSPGAPYWLFALLLALLTGRHILASVENQNNDLLIFLCSMLAIDSWCVRRSRTAGLMAGVGAALKATPLLFLLPFLCQRKFGAAVTLMLTAAVLLFLPDVLFPAQDGVSWAVTWYRTYLTGIRPGASASSAGWTSWNQLNQSLAGTLHRYFTPPPWAGPGMFDITLIRLDPWALKGVILAGQLAVVGWLLWVTRPGLTHGLPDGEKSFRTLGEGAAVLCAMVLLSPMSSKSHFCVLLVPSAFCLADFLYRRRDPVVGAALVLTFMLGTMTVKGILGQPLGNRVLAYGTVTGCALVLFVATGRVLLQRSKLACCVAVQRPVADRVPAIAIPA